jgi:hypothetical protein
LIETNVCRTMAIDPLFASFEAYEPIQLQARVGAALWTISISPGAVGILMAQSAPEGRPTPNLDMERIMESVRLKALSLRLYGGGYIALDGLELCAPLESISDDEGSPVTRKRWFTLIGTPANDAT